MRQRVRGLDVSTDLDFSAYYTLTCLTRVSMKRRVIRRFGFGLAAVTEARSR